MTVTISGTSGLSNVPAGNIAATNTQAAINELDAEKALLAGSPSQAFSASTLTVATDAIVPSLNGGQLAGFRNKVINGGMTIAQRGTSFVNCINTYTLDRWRAIGGPCNVTISQLPQPYTVCTSGYGMRFGRTSGETLTNNIGVHYSMETRDSWGLVNKTVTLSFRCQKGSNFSSVGNTLNFSIISGTGIDEKSASYTGAVSINNSAAITASPTTYTVTGIIPTTATEVGIVFSYTPTGTAGASDYVDICDVQLEVGSIATPFEQRPFGIELTLCQRYYEVGNYALYLPIPGTGYSGGRTPYKVLKRANPTLTITDSAANTGKISIVTNAVGGQTHNNTYFDNGSSASEIAILYTGGVSNYGLVFSYKAECEL